MQPRVYEPVTEVDPSTEHPISADSLSSRGTDSFVEETESGQSSGSSVDLLADLEARQDAVIDELDKLEKKLVGILQDFGVTVESDEQDALETDVSHTDDIQDEDEESSLPNAA